MRKIKFRAKRRIYDYTDNSFITLDKWIEGSLVDLDLNKDDVFIIPEYKGASTMPHTQLLSCVAELVDRDTISQFTGLYDKNGKEIYEGDIVEGFRRRAIVKIGHVHNNKNSIYGVFAEWVRYGLIEAQYIDKIDRGDYVEVIGNIYENEELLNESEKQMLKVEIKNTNKTVKDGCKIEIQKNETKYKGKVCIEYIINGKIYQHYLDVDTENLSQTLISLQNKINDSIFNDYGIKVDSICIYSIYSPNSSQENKE